MNDEFTMIIHSPARIRTLLDCYLRQATSMNPEAPVLTETIQEFLELGIIEPNDDSQFEGKWMTTPRGDAWVRSLCKTAIPQPAFVDSSGNVL